MRKKKFQEIVHKKIVELFGIDCEVKQTSDNLFQRVAPVSKNESATGSGKPA